MKKISYIFLGFIVLIIALWRGPNAINFLLGSTATKIPAVFYSSISKTFIIQENINGERIIKDAYGSTLTRNNFDSLLPALSAKQLAADNRLPDSILGYPVSLKTISDNNFVFTFKPYEINCYNMGLYSMMESASGRVELENPIDIFRITDKGIEFINKTDNTINWPKSKLFTEAMLKEGFNFPHKVLAANMSIKKEYDEGFLMVDNDYTLFHIKMVGGQPFVKRINTQLKIKELFVLEPKSHKYYGLLIDTDNNIYALTAPDYNTIKLDIPPTDPAKCEIYIIANMFDWTVRITSSKELDYYALDANTLKQLDTYKIYKNTRLLRGLYFMSTNETWIRPRI